MKSDGLARRIGRIEELVQQGKHLLKLMGNGVVAFVHLGFQLGQPFGQFLMDAE